MHPLATLLPAPAPTGASAGSVGTGKHVAGTRAQQHGLHVHHTCVLPPGAACLHPVTCFILSFSSAARRRASSFLWKQSSCAEPPAGGGRRPGGSRTPLPGVPLPPRHHQTFIPKRRCPCPMGHGGGGGDGAWGGLGSGGATVSSPDPPPSMQQGGSGCPGPPGMCQPLPHLEVPPAVHIDVHQRPELDERVPHAPVPLPAGRHPSPSATHQCPPTTTPGTPTWPGNPAPGSAEGRSFGGGSESAS